MLEIFVPEPALNRSLSLTRKFVETEIRNVEKTTNG